MSADQKVATEVALSEFDRFTATMDLNLNPADWSDDEKKTFADLKNKILRAMERGFLVIDDQGQPVYTPQIGVTDPITFYEPNGATIMAIDKAKKDAEAQKGLNLMAAMTKQPPTRFSSMMNRDLKICQAVTMLFLQSA